MDLLPDPTKALCRSQKAQSEIDTRIFKPDPTSDLVCYGTCMHIGDGSGIPFTNDWPSQFAAIYVKFPLKWCFYG